MKCSLFFVFLFFLYLKWLIIRVDVKKFKKIFVKCLQISKFCVPLPYAPRKGVTLVTPFFVVYQAIKALGVDGEHIKIGCIFTGNLPVFPDFYRYFHL